MTSTQQYVQHDWSAATWTLMLSLMIVFVLGLMGAFLVTATRSAGGAESARRQSATEPVPDAALEDAA